MTFRMFITGSILISLLQSSPDALGTVTFIRQRDWIIVALILVRMKKEKVK
jgi:hypothetical protein